MSGQYSVFTKEEIADANSRGISTKLLHIRYGDLKWSKKQALLIEKNADRIFTDEHLARMEEKEISYNTVYSRLFKSPKKWTIDEAIDTPVRKRKI